MGRAGRSTKAFIKLLGSNADEAAQMFITKADELGRQVINLGKGKIDDLGTKLDDLAAKGEKILSGDFGDVKKYFKSLLPGEYTLVATPEGQVFRIAKGELGETSLELAARNGDGVVNGVLEGTGEGYQSAQSPMFGDDWNNYFGEKYGQGNVTWKPNSLEDVIQNPQRLYGASQSEVASMLGEGWTAGTYGSSGTGWKFTNGDGMVFYHVGGGIHSDSYYGFSSGATGKIKIVGSDYIPLTGDKATVIYYNGGN